MSADVLSWSQRWASRSINLRLLLAVLLMVLLALPVLPVLPVLPLVVVDLFESSL